MMSRDYRPFGIVSALLVVSALLAPSAFGAAAPQSTDLWGGPGAKGTGLHDSHYETNVYVSSLVAASATVDFYVAGAIAASRTVPVPARGVVIVAAPEALTNQGAFLYHVTASAAVTVWSETFTSGPDGQFGLSVDGFTTADFLNPGDEAAGGGAETSTDTDAGKSRTNAGVLCSPNSAQRCQVEVTAFDAGTSLGTGTLDAPAGGTDQRGLASLIPGSADRTLLTLRFRVLQGIAAPYAIRNYNNTSDALSIPLAVTRSAFSTAPVVTSFTVSPSSGCAPQAVNLTWATTGASRVTISGAAGDLPPSGSTTVTLVASTDLVLTAYSSTGDATSVPRHVTVLPPTEAPTPVPAQATVIVGAKLQGTLGFPAGPVTVEFVQQQSQGSSFVVNSGSFQYIAGTSPGTDIVKLTIQGACGPASATFTATVTEPGAPQITSFFADPARGCAPQAVSVNWTTLNSEFVNLSGVSFRLSPNGGYGVLLSTTTTFTLEAHGFDGTKVTKSLTVPIDAGLEYPVLSTSNLVTVQTNSVVVINITGVTNSSGLRFNVVARPSGGELRKTGPFQYTYYAGYVPDVQDFFRIYYTNACGFTYVDFRANVISPP